MHLGYTVVSGKFAWEKTEWFGPESKLDMFIKSV